MNKNFSKWHGVKEFINNIIRPERYMDRGEIWWAYLGANAGYEQDGKGDQFKRPVLIIRKLTRNLFLVIPLTTRNKNNWFYVPCPARDGIFRMAILVQVKVIDERRLADLITKIEPQDLRKIKQVLRNKIL